MEECIIHCKTNEYFNRYYVSSRMGKQEKARKLALTALVMLRLESRIAHQKLESLRHEIRAAKRDIRKMGENGVTFPLVEQRIEKLEEEKSAAQKKLASIGSDISLMLDLWQMSGATFEDLCNLCNRDPAQVRRELLESESAADSFSELATVHNLDYKDPKNSGWLEDSIDAPLTHGLKAYLFDTMLHTEEGRRASREAMETVFPEIMDHAVTMVTDEDGTRRLIDKDGNEVGTLDDEGRWY